MSMLTAQCENLRIMARLVRDYDYREISRELREAADTIESLRNRLTECEATPTDELISSMRQTISCEREAYEMLSRTYDAARDHILYQKEQLDEIRAKLEDYKRGGTCTMIGSSRPSGEEDWESTCVCSECHAEVMTTWLGNEPLYTPHYCPNCGRQVVG